MLHAGVDLSCHRLDVCLLSDHGELVEQAAAPPDADGLRGLVGRVARHRQPVRTVIESMNGARFVHDPVRARRPRAAGSPGVPDPWPRNVDASRQLIDDLELQIASLTYELKRQGADHRYIPLLVTAPGFGWINAFT